MSFNPRPKVSTLIIRVGDDPVDALVAGAWMGAIHERLGTQGTYVHLSRTRDAAAVHQAVQAWAGQVAQTQRGILGIVGVPDDGSLDARVREIQRVHHLTLILRRPAQSGDPFAQGELWSCFAREAEFDPTESGIRYDLFPASGDQGWLYIPGDKDRGGFAAGHDHWYWPNAAKAWTESFTLKKANSNLPPPGQTPQTKHRHGNLTTAGDCRPVRKVNDRAFVHDGDDWEQVVIIKPSVGPPRFHATAGMHNGGYISPDSLTLSLKAQPSFSDKPWACFTPDS